MTTKKVRLQDSVQTDIATVTWNDVENALWTMGVRDIELVTEVRVTPTCVFVVRNLLNEDGHVYYDAKRALVPKWTQAIPITFD